MNATKIVYRCRRSFKGLTISDSLDLATNRTQSSLYSNLPPESIELDLICADKIFSNKGSSRNGHLFCPVPLDGDTFCDHCNQPIWELGWRPVCFKCAKCHMTCHWLCKDEVAVVCDDDAKTIKHASEVVPLFPKIVPEHNEQKVESTVFELSASLENDSTDCVPCEGILANNHLTSESDISPLDTSLNDLNEMNSPVENLIDHVPSERFAPQSISSSLGQHTFTTTDCSTQLDVSAKMDCGTPTKLKVESLLPPTLSRRATDCYKSKKSVGVKLVTRHSFLCGNKPNVCLAYDFSSLDKEAIRDRGIFVRHLSPSLNELQNTSEPLQSTNLISDISNFDTLVLSNERSISKPEVSDIGLASVIQTTQEFIRTKPKRSFQTHLLSSTTLPLIPMVVGPRSVLPWSSDRLKQLVQIFSMNEFGLQAANLTGSDSCDCEGQVRVHINLLRPIQMLLTARPASIFDVVSSKSGERNDDSEDDEDEDEDVSNGIENDQCLRLTQCENDNNYSTVSHSFIPTANIPNLPSNVDRVYKAERNIIGSHHRLCRTASKVSTFRLPRGSTKVLHVRLSTTAQMVICALLDRFGIQDNPQKFALYEHTIEGDQKVNIIGNKPILITFLTAKATTHKIVCVQTTQTRGYTLNRPYHTPKLREITSVFQ
ncbi:Ras association domain-containing protein [Schistosoma japonicum]|nr:Ras association domain-containing protein [Schistosoma japonicum]